MTVLKFFLTKLPNLVCLYIYRFSSTKDRQKGGKRVCYQMLLKWPIG